jgi:glycerol kinase
MSAMTADSGVALTQMRVDGGITASELCMQIQADVMGIEIIRPQITETTALGAAYAAGLAIGYWESIEEIKANWRESKRWLPVKSVQERATGAARWKAAVARTLNWVE